MCLIISVDTEINMSNLKPNASIIDFEKADLSNVLLGKVANPFPAYPEIKMLEVNNGPALILNIENGPAIKGKALYKPAYWFLPLTSVPHHLRFKLDQSYTVVQFDYRHRDAPKILVKLYSGDSVIAEGEHTDLSGGGDKEVKLTAEHFKVESFDGFSLEVYQWRDTKDHAEFIIDNLTLK